MTASRARSSAIGKDCEKSRIGTLRLSFADRFSPLLLVSPMPLPRPHKYLQRSKYRVGLLVET